MNPFTIRNFNIKTLTLLTTSLLTMSGCAIDPYEEATAASEDEIVAGTQLAPSITTKKAELYLFFAAGGVAGGRAHVVGPLDLNAPERDNSQTLDLRTSRAVRLAHDKLRLDYVAMSANDSQPVTVIAQIAFNNSTKFTPLPVENGAVTTFYPPRGAKSMQVYFESQELAPTNAPQIREGAEFTSMSMGGVAIYTKVVRHADDGQLWLHSWDSNGGQNFSFTVKR